MSWTKRQLINKAFSVAGLASFVFSLTPDQLQDALLSLDSQMGTWDGQGIRVGYPLTTSPENSDLDHLFEPCDTDCPRTWQDAFQRYPEKSQTGF